MRITDSDVDQARAAGVLIEFRTRPADRRRPRAVPRARQGGAINRTHDDLEPKATAAAKEKKTAGASNMDVARFLVCALLGADQDKSAYSQSGERSRASSLAACGWSSTSCASGPDPGTVAKRDAQLGELIDQAHGANLDLGNALIHTLTTVDPGDK